MVRPRPASAFVPPARGAFTSSRTVANCPCAIALPPVGCGLAAHHGEDLQVGFRLCAQGILHPLAVLVKSPSDDPAAALELTAPDLLQLLLEAPLQLSHLLLLQALQVRQRPQQALLLE